VVYVMIYLLTFATGEFLRIRSRFEECALKNGIDRVLSATPQNYIGTRFHYKNESVLQEHRGAGYWMWKPWLILENLKKLDEGDVLIYSDVGRYDYFLPRLPPRFLVRSLDSNAFGYLLGPLLYQHGALRKWVHSRCLNGMGVDISDNILDRPTVQATWSLWRNTKASRSFLEEWLHHCETPGLINDIRAEELCNEHPDFVDHRHDQSILSILAHKTNAPFLDFGNHFSTKLFTLRPSMQLAHFYLKSYSDAEELLMGGGLSSLCKSFVRARNSLRGEIVAKPYIA
jgi:hypothetical protein